jgi:site-specific DNA recombinase
MRKAWKNCKEDERQQVRIALASAMFGAKSTSRGARFAALSRSCQLRRESHHVRMRPIDQGERIMIMNIAIYARVSSEKQAKEGTIESQLEALREYAKANKLTISHECIDDGVTGTTLNRPGLDYLKDLIAEDLIQGILILSPDRLSREQTHQILLMDEFKKQDIQVIFTTQQFEDNAEGNLMLQVQAAVSEYERKKILERTKRGRKHAVKNGQMLGSMAAYGYRFMPKGDGKPARWEVEPREIEIVRLIFDLYVNKRMKGTQIARYLESEEFQTRSGTTKWWCSVVYRILKSEAYLGNAYMYKNSYVEPIKTPKSKKYRKVKNSALKPRPREDWIGIPVTPTIEKSLWDAAQVLLKQNAHSARRHNNKNQYLVRGLVVCGLCGCMASGYVSNKSSFYSCGARRNKNIHSKPHDELIQVHHKPFDAKVWQGVTELMQPENIMAQLEKRLERRHSARPSIASTDAKTEKDLEKLNIQEERVIDAYRGGIIDLEQLKIQKEKLATKRKVLEAKQKAIPSHTESVGQPEITLDMLGDMSARFQRAMAKADFETREKLVNLLVNSVTLYTNKAVVKGNIPVIRGDVLNPSNLASSFFLLSSRVHARPRASISKERGRDANRWAADAEKPNRTNCLM